MEEYFTEWTSFLFHCFLSYQVRQHDYSCVDKQAGKKNRNKDQLTNQLKEKSPTVKCPEFNQCPLHLNGHSTIIIQDLDLCVRRDHCGSLRTPNSTLPTQWSAPLAYLLSCLCFIARLLLTETSISSFFFSNPEFHIWLIQESFGLSLPHPNLKLLIPLYSYPSSSTFPPPPPHKPHPSLCHPTPSALTSISL